MDKKAKMMSKIEKKQLKQKEEERLINLMLINISIALGMLVALGYIYNGLRSSAVSITRNIVFGMFILFLAAAVGFVVWGFIKKDLMKKLLKYSGFFLLTAIICALTRWTSIPAMGLSWNSLHILVGALILIIADIVLIIAYCFYKYYKK